MSFYSTRATSKLLLRPNSTTTIGFSTQQQHTWLGRGGITQQQQQLLLQQQQWPTAAPLSMCSSRLDITSNSTVARFPRKASAESQILVTRILQQKPLQGIRGYSSNNSLPPKDSNPVYKGGIISWQAVAGAATVSLIGIYMLNHLKKEKEANLAAKRQISIGKASLGGEWNLIDHHGNRKSSKDFHGNWVLLYFGFSFCPDICPEEMEKLVEAVDRIDSDPSLPNVIPIFITLDPERDTPLHLAAYVREFSPKVIGMTGSAEQIAQAAKAYRIYFSAGPKDEDNDYIVDHSIIKYLVNPEGEFEEYFGQNKTAAEIYTTCRDRMKAARKK